MTALSDPTHFADKQNDWLSYFDGRRRQEINALLTPEVIAEHERNPIGYRAPHSPDLQQVLNYMRTQPVLGKYFVYTVTPWQDYVVATIGGRGEAPTYLDDEHYASEEEAMHGVFMLRVNDIRTSATEGAL